MREVNTNHNPYYFISNVLTGPETHYQKIEKISFASVIELRKLWRYILSHSIGCQGTRDEVWEVT